jgi:hypothetical protein
MVWEGEHCVSHGLGAVREGVRCVSRGAVGGMALWEPWERTSEEPSSEKSEDMWREATAEETSERATCK